MITHNGKKICSSANLDVTETFTGSEFWDTDDNALHKIYQTMVVLPNNAFANTTMKTVPHNIPNIDKIISCSGFTIQSANGQMLPLQFAAATQANSIIMYADRTNIEVQANLARAGNNYNRCILQYTCTDR